MKNLLTSSMVALLLSLPFAAHGATSAAVQQVIDLTNDERRLAGLPALREAAALDNAAQGHAADQARRGYFSHVTPEGITVTQRVKKAGYKGWGGWENIYYGWGKSTGSPSAAVEGWMKSPGHRANILNRQIEEIGVGIAYDKSGKAYFVQNFGRS
jgi:uncharacterized protein YkwD